MAEKKTIGDYVFQAAPYVLGIVAVGFVVKQFKLFTGQGGNPNEGKSDENIKTVKESISNKTASGEKPNYSDAQFKTFADNLAAAMQGAGTDTSAVFSIMAYPRSDLDVLKLVDAFGLRENQYLWMNLGKMNLGEWLRSELDATDMSRVNTTLFHNGVNLQF